MKTSKHTLTLEDAAAFTGYSPGTMQKYSKHPPKWGPPAPHVMGKNPGQGPKRVRLYSKEELTAWLEIRERYLADRDAHRAKKKTDYDDLTGIIGRQASELLEAQMAVKAAHRKIKTMREQADQARKEQTRTIEQLRAEVEQLKAELQKRPQTTRRSALKTKTSKEVSSLRTALKTKTDEAERFRRTVADQSHAIDRLRETVADQSHEIDRLNEEASQLRSAHVPKPSRPRPMTRPRPRPLEDIITELDGRKAPLPIAKRVLLAKGPEVRKLEALTAMNWGLSGQSKSVKLATVKANLLARLGYVIFKGYPIPIEKVYPRASNVPSMGITKKSALLRQIKEKWDSL